MFAEDLDEFLDAIYGHALAATLQGGAPMTPSEAKQMLLGQWMQLLPFLDRYLAALEPARYQDLLGIYSELWPKLSDWNQKLVDFSRSAHK